MGVAISNVVTLGMTSGHLQNGAVGHSRNRQTEDFSVEEKYFELQDSLQLIRNSNRINQNIFQVSCNLTGLCSTELL